MAGQYLANFTCQYEGRVNERHGEKQQRGDGGISLMPRAAQKP